MWTPQQLRSRADQRAGDGVGWANRFGETDRLCETLSSWRLLVGGLSPAASHHSFITSSEEPPLSNFNSYRDIPSVIARRIQHGNVAYRLEDAAGRSLPRTSHRL